MKQLLALVLTLGFGCSSSSLGPITKELSLSKDAFVLDGLTLTKSNLPNYCGPESLKAIFDFYKVENSLDLIKDAIYDPEFKGTKPSKLISYAREKGFKVELFKGTLHTLESALLQNLPPLIILEIAKNLRHFLLVAGIDKTKQFIIGANYDSYILIKFDDLIARWAKCDFQQINISKQDEFSSLVERAIIFHETNKTEIAITMYRKALDIKSDSSVHASLAECYETIGDKNKAVYHYKEANKLNPTNPIIMNNLANLLLELDQELELGLSLIQSSVIEFEKLYKSDSSKDHSSMLSSALTTLGEYHEFKKDYESAVNSFIKSYELISSDHPEKQKKRAKKIASCYRKIGQIILSNEWYEKAGVKLE